MYESFEKIFSPDSRLSKLPLVRASFQSPHVGLSELFARFGGVSFNSALYRVMTPGAVDQWEGLVCDAFPQFAGRISPFSYDWLGRVFAVDSSRKEKDGYGVVLLEPGTGEVLEIPCGLRSFHDEELVGHRDEALAESFHERWLNIGGGIPTRTQCVGYKNPLFLGGKDTVSNLEIVDIDVYWTLFGSLIRKTKGLPAGTRVGAIKLTE